MAEVTAIVYKVRDTHVAVHGPVTRPHNNPNNNSSPSRYRHCSNKPSEQNRQTDPSRYRHTTTRIPQDSMDPLAMPETHSRLINEDSRMNETKHEWRTRKAARGAGNKAKRREQENEPATDSCSCLRKRAIQPNSRYEVADLKNDPQGRHNTRERSKRVCLRKRATQSNSGYEVADLKNDPQDRHDTRERSKRPEHIRKPNPSSYRQSCTRAHKANKRLNPSRY